jgi:succinate-acetate transporter protein
MTVHELTDDRAPESVEQHRARAAASPAVLANPAALGLAGFALANLLLSVINAGWLPHRRSRQCCRWASSPAESPS